MSGENYNLYHVCILIVCYLSGDEKPKLSILEPGQRISGAGELCGRCRSSTRPGAAFRMQISRIVILYFWVSRSLILSYDIRRFIGDGFK